MPDVYMEIRYKIQQAMERVPAVAAATHREFETAFGRSYEMIEPIACDDAETVLVTTGTTTSPARVLVERARQEGKKLGALKLRYFRPFPVDDVRRALKGKKRVIVVDRNISFGKGGIWADELRGALADMPSPPKIWGYITGLGGRDITPDLLGEIVAEVEASKKPDRLIYWKGLKP
jgi:pyruvate/2-oxoacid:ferredoxin oxidoreductase alpha subunit